MVVLTNSGMSLNTPPKYKRRKLSPLRDFPKGCGISKPCETYHVLVGCTESLKASGLNSEKALNEGLVVKAMETSKHVVMENMMVLDQKELVRPSKTLELESTSSSKNMNQMEYDGLECNYVVENNSQLEETDQPQTSIPAWSSMRNHYPPPRRISVSRDFPPDCCKRMATSRDSPGCCTRTAACRNFPPGCGGTALKLIKEQCLKLIGSSKIQSSENVTPGQNVLKAMAEHDQVQSASHSKLKKEDIKEDASVRPASTSNLGPPETKSSLMSKDVKRVLAHPEKEFVELSKEKRLKRKLHGNSEEESYSLSQSQREVSTGLRPYCNTEIVLALMAAPYCPWRQEEEVSKSPPLGGLVGGKRKRNDAHVNSEFLSIKEDGFLGLEVKSTKGKMPPSRKDSYQSIDNQLVLTDGYDSPDDEDVGNFALVPRSQANCSSLIPFDFHAITRNKVRETLRLFQVISRKLLRDEESKPKEKYNGRRIDIIAADILKEKNKWVNVGKQILGTVPGVEVGDEFHYRVELAIIGLHRQYQGGIDYLRQGHRTLATSIVFSGRYDDIDCSESSDILVYSGQGGNQKIKNKRSEDQRLERGNLALKNSMDESSPVRVIRGFKQTKADARGKIVTTYTYDGLYLVESFWQEKGRHGKNVFKYQLRRIQGQPELALKEVKKSEQLKLRDGRFITDISQGKEKMPIGAVNTIDNEKPPSFKYVTNMVYPSWYSPTPPKGCECINGCSDSEECLCAVKNGGEIPFNYDGDIVFAKPLVYECGPSCKCPPSCHNRVSQHGIKFQLEIFKTKSTGWGVRSLTSIPSGSFVCEYTGELLEDMEAEQRTGSDEYLFDIGKNYSDCTLWEGLSDMMPPDLQSIISCDTVEDGGFSIDALKYGNVGRFINHSCSPNLYAQNILYDHDDKRIPHVMLFAAENIPPLQELTYHYNYNIGQVLDSSGNIKKKQCCCGSGECSGRLY